MAVLKKSIIIFHSITVFTVFLIEINGLVSILSKNINSLQLFNSNVFIYG